MNLRALQLLFDAHPEAIFTNNASGKTPLNCAREQPCSSFFGVVDFLEAQLTYVRRAQDATFMTTPDHNGQLPLHRALRNNASLGAIKLLVKGNTAALKVADRRGAFPLHVACEFCSAGVVQLLVDLDSGYLDAYDVNENSPFHYACRGCNCGAIKYLLGKSAPSVSKRNAGNKLPVHLLCECGGDTADRESLEYVEAIWLLLLAHPETVLS